MTLFVCSRRAGTAIITIRYNPTYLLSAPNLILIHLELLTLKNVLVLVEKKTRSKRMNKKKSDKYICA